MVVDLFLVYQFIRRLVTPFNKWEAYELGIIDDKGNILRKKRDRTPEERRKFGVFDIMILKLKKLLAKIPGGTTKLASYATALWLIREWNHFSSESLLVEDVSEDQIDESIDKFINERLIPLLNKDT
jgi:hypothetical protein